MSRTAGALVKGPLAAALILGLALVLPAATCSAAIGRRRSRLRRLQPPLRTAVSLAAAVGPSPGISSAVPSRRGRRLDARDEPDEPARSLMAPVAAALIVGLALGFAGGYVLGGRRGTPAVASAPPAATPSKSAGADDTSRT